MLAIDIAVVVLLAVVTVAVVGARAAKSIAAPREPVELARAARLLDRVAASDDALPQLPATLRHEVDAFLERYYKELKQ